MTRTYKDYTIRVEKHESIDYGKGLRAEFFIPKTDGTKERQHILFDYDKKQKPGTVIEKVMKFIDTL